MTSSKIPEWLKVELSRVVAAVFVQGVKQIFRFLISSRIFFKTRRDPVSHLWFFFHTATSTVHSATPTTTRRQRDKEAAGGSVLPRSSPSAANGEEEEGEEAAGGGAFPTGTPTHTGTK